MRSAQLKQGCVLFNAGQAWAAHETWEKLWLAWPRGAVRNSIQASIMLCGVAFLLGRHRNDAARRLAARALELGFHSGSPIQISGAEAVLRVFPSSNDATELQNWQVRFASLRAKC